MSKKHASEAMIGFAINGREGEDNGNDLGGTTLHARRSGMKKMRKKERVTSCDAAQTCSAANLQRYRPTQSPRLKTKK